MKGRWPDARAFPSEAHDALSDAQLRRNLRQATATIRTKRAAAVAEVPDWQDLRSQARRSKDEALTNLPELLNRLEAEVTRRGGHVHRAPNGDVANAIVARIAKQAGAKQVVKVKSMATQEIGLNEALADAGIEAVETDLAELIVQLGEDRPSHILVPAIHRNCQEIGAIFRSRMPGVRPDLASDPTSLAEASRLYLRRRFLEARVAVSGANFAIAETGTVGVVESEGNGRMCVTLPETLITVVGVEKVLASVSDLGPFMQLLPRSSTGERMNPYTSTWSGVTPGDGPKNFHLILLDNGREEIRNDPVGRQTLACIRCSACLNVCPVYERTGGHAYGSVYPGPIGAVLTPLLDPGADTDSLPFASSLCGACLEVCPVQIDIPAVLIELRRRTVESKRARRSVPWPGSEATAMRLLAWVFSDPERLARAQRSGSVASRLLIAAKLAARAATGASGDSPGSLRFAPGPLGAWTATRDAPLPPAESFRAWWARTQTGAATSASMRLERKIPAEPPDATTATDAPKTGHQPAAHAGMVDLFVERVADYRARVHRCKPGDLAVLLGDLLANPPDLPAGSSPSPAGPAVLVPADIDERWLPAGIEILADRADLPAGELDACRAVITGCRVAIAETGTVILDGGPAQGRRAATLLPDHHLCVVDTSQVVASVPDAVAALDFTRPLTWVSGPSATSDIELRRVEGVHGPRRLDVIVLEQT